MSTAESKLKDVNYQLVLSITDEAKVITAKLIIDNQVLAHRLRLRLKTDIETDYAHAQIQGGFRETKNEPIATNWNDEFVEKPVNIYLFDRMVGLRNQNQGLYFLGTGQKEYEKVGDALYITLMATTGQLGKPDLLWRPGRASGDTTSVGHIMMPTPMAQEQGLNEFTFGLYATSSQPVTEESLSKQLTKWYSPSVSYQLQKYNLFVNRLDNKLWDIEFAPDLPKLARTQSWLNLKPDLEVAALYPAYTVKDNLVLRLSNLTGETQDASYLKDEGFIVVNGLEETIAQDYQVAPYDLITLIKPI